MTNLNDVEYYLPLYDHNGDIDPEAHYHRTRLARARDFGLSGVDDAVANGLLECFPELAGTDAATLSPVVRAALVDMARLIEQYDPEDPSTDDAMEAGVARTRALMKARR